jgi:hypothetical protein
MQTVGLAQQVLEQEDIATASITLLENVTAKIRPPRALAVPYPLGFPLGEADNPPLQRSILTALLELVGRSDVPVLESWRAVARPDDGS